ncbi:MAG: adenylyltransferase/cytidyltransferase family protein [Bacteroidetes bacterium]|nr:adenylyltransferase/cytidyltransferase family protein [Bacteroidota bacterium]
MSARLEYIKSKIVSTEEAIRLVAMYHLKNEKVVFTNGCFDILHLGHITYLAEAASLGNRLIVGINSDRSVKALNKAPNRPINNELARMNVIASLGFVDLVVIFNEETPFELIRPLEPDVLVKGGDYDANELDSSSKKYIVGSDIVRKKGGSVVTINLVEGYSTTALIEKSKSL